MAAGWSNSTSYCLCVVSGIRIFTFPGDFPTIGCSFALSKPAACLAAATRTPETDDDSTGTLLRLQQLSTRQPDAPSPAPGGRPGFVRVPPAGAAPRGGPRRA